MNFGTIGNYFFIESHIGIIDRKNLNEQIQILLLDLCELCFEGVTDDDLG